MCAEMPWDLWQMKPCVKTMLRCGRGIFVEVGVSRASVKPALLDDIVTRFVCFRIDVRRNTCLVCCERMRGQECGTKITRRISTGSSQTVSQYRALLLEVTSPSNQIKSSTGPSLSVLLQDTTRPRLHHSWHGAQIERVVRLSWSTRAL